MPKKPLSFREKAFEIASSQTSTDAYESLMTYLEENPKVWADILTEDKVSLRRVCTAAILDAQHEVKRRIRQSSETIAPLETVGAIGKVQPKESQRWSPEQEEKAREADKRAEERNRAGIYETVIYGVRLGDMKTADMSRIEKRYRSEASANAKEAYFLSELKSKMPDDKTRVRDAIKPRTLQAMWKASKDRTYVAIRVKKRKDGRGEDYDAA